VSRVRPVNTPITMPIVTASKIPAVTNAIDLNGVINLILI